MTNANATKDDAQAQAAAQYESIVSMLAAVNCDFSRLDELVEELEGLDEALDVAQGEDEKHAAVTALVEWNTEYRDELKALQATAGDCANEDDAREAIHISPLSVQVRSDWTTPGEDLTPGEFMILLCTGGPAVRIMGEIGQHGEPDRAWLEYQDWGTTWTRYYCDSDVLLEYAAHFIFQM